MTHKLHEPTFGEDEIAAVVDVLRSTMVTQGRKVEEFENEFSPGAVACNSGSSANLLAISALKACGIIKEGGEIIVPALSWSTTVWPIVQCGLIPVFVDCDPGTLNMIPGEVAAAMSTRTQAVMPVHVYGNPCDMDEIRDAVPLGMPIIEDCCEAMGADYKGEPIGISATVATFSTYFSHHITTIEGGLAVAQNEEVENMMRIQRSHGWVRDCDNATREKYSEKYYDIDPRFLFVDMGYNLRMSEPAAAMGLVQLPKLSGIVNARRKAWVNLRNAVEEYDFLKAQDISEGSSCFGFAMTIEDDAPFSRADLCGYLNHCGIETRPIICGNMAEQPAMKKYPHRVHGNLENASRVMRQGFSVGCHQGVTQGDADHLADVIGVFLRER